VELEPACHRKHRPNISLTLPEFFSKVIQESVPEGSYQHNLETMAASYCRGSQDDLALDLIPSITCSAASGDLIKAIPVTAAWQLIRLAAKLFDDVEDGEAGDRSAEVNNLATGYLFASYTAFEKLVELGTSCEQSQRVRKRFNQACLQTCAGQDVDLSTRWDREVPTPDDWQEVARSKSGVLFAWASWAGAVVAGASQEVQDSFWEYGLHLGILVQIADDYNGIWNSPLKTDLSAYRVTLPISYAHFVANPDERNTLLSLLREANLGAADAKSEGRDLITALGTQKFILAAAQVQRHEAVEAIRRLCLSNQADESLYTLLDNTFPALVHLPLISYENSTQPMANFE
jgi:geranylgeranyl pyrophosphate synthase